MKRATVLFLVFSVPVSRVTAQLMPGDILINNYAPEHILHYRPDGTHVLTTNQGISGVYQGVSLRRAVSC